ncbi:SAM-dependent methyltransferase [Streptomyces sp. SID8379]|uniref:class I SAM-dependent methyltransferase family protein n=1 Tax=unclassified Streptomyces TaxID=2593676 RepID=UPI0003673459|nr:MULTISPECIES: class I SAM-dependent methyltransferase family protein [unclassified Streptomyces]MYW63041.1 SAM-dependent methyltransferase [Streptomyces sp. SID8379]
MDWHAWHTAYDDPRSRLARRLVAVRERIREALDDCPPGPVRALSICAGQGVDLLGVLAEHPRRGDVTARLVELDPRNADAARAAAAAADLKGVEVVTGDAALPARYVGAAPAELVLACGVFGNITAEDIARTLDHCTHLVASGGTLVWTRGRVEPDLFPTVRRWLAERGFEELWVSAPDADFGVGAHRFAGRPLPLADPAAPMFTFVGYDRLRRRAG